MATDVSGTIHIIAEVMGDASSPNVAPGEGSAVGPDKRIGKTAKTLSIMGIQVRKLIKLITVGGLLKFSQNISNSLSGFFRMVGVLVDLFFIPFAPAFVRALQSLYPILTYLAKLSVGEKNMGDIWGDMGDWWSNQVEEEGGIWGAIKKLALDVSSVGLLGGLLVLADPTGFVWKASKYVIKHLFQAASFSRSFILDAFGLRKGTPLRKRNLKGVKTGRAISRFAVNVKNLIKTGDFRKLFFKGALLGKAWISRAFGFAINLAPSLGGSKWKTVAKISSKLAVLGGMVLTNFLRFLVDSSAGMFLRKAGWGAARAGLRAGASLLMGAAFLGFIAGAAVIAGTVVGIAWLFQKLFPYEDPDYVQKQIKQSQEEGEARSRDPMEQMPTFIHGDADRMAEFEVNAAYEEESQKRQVLINRQIPAFP